MPRKVKCKNGFDFAGWATVANTLCSDGRTIMKDAFIDNDGQTVPLVWNHDHDSPLNVLGHALLENADEGVIAYCKFNDTESGQAAKTIVKHKDVCGLSIYANRLKQQGGNVLHGQIREVSLVLAGANPGAFIEDVMVHSDGTADEARIWNDSEEIYIFHSEDPKSEKPETESMEGEKAMAEEKKAGGEKTVGEVFDTLTDEQKTVVYALIGQAIEDAKGGNDEDDEDDKEESPEMKHNIFDNDSRSFGNVLSHSDFEAIKTNAKRAGSFKDAFNDYLESELYHDDEPVTYTDREGNEINYNTDGNGNPYFIGNYDYMFPDARLVGDRPAMIQRDTTWVSKVTNAAKHSPFSRIKTLVADITEDAARAKGYIKGHYKKEEFFSLMKRSTTPTTVYKKQKMDRDDVIDITEWDVVAWIKGEMRKMLDEEIARAILIGDGRLSSDDDHIDTNCIRPIVSDADLYTIKVTLPALDAETSTGSQARDLIRSIIANRKLYKGSGNPTLFTTEDALTEMLLLTDEIGRDLYESEAKLATKLRVKEIVTVPVLENNADNVVAILVNMSDYTIGADKGGAINMFDDFDIDYNQQKYLIETRLSGALVLPYSAMVFKTASAAAEGLVPAGDHVLNP